jgi:hypothetical protein
MENLTKQQIVLLTLLVSFMTSIATGIVTVSLMDQAPQSVTQTINRVVERTIEKITPVATKTDQNQTTVKETVVVNQDDQIVGAVDKNSKTLARLYKKTVDGDIFSGLAAWVSVDGNLITTSSIDLTDGEKLLAKSSDDNIYELALVGSKDGLTVYKVKTETVATSSLPLKFTPATFANQNIKLGQSIVTLSGEKNDYVLSGIVSGLVDKKITVENVQVVATSTSETASTTASSTQAEIVYKYIQTNLSSKDLSSGTLLLNLSGEIVGMNSRSEEMFVPVGVIKMAQSFVK